MHRCWSARDHKRKADQIWIDTLQGKYANLPVDKVIAVARAGVAKTCADGSKSSREIGMARTGGVASGRLATIRLPNNVVPRPDFSGDFHPASREIKQERRPT